MKERIAYAYETLTVTSGNVVLNLTSSVFTRPNAQPPIEALITVNPGPPISYLLVGTVTATVSSATGHKLTAYGSLLVYGLDAIRNFQTTSVSSGTTGSIAVTYFRGQG